MSWFGTFAGLLGGLTAALVVCGGAAAQDLEPRGYTNLPIGLNFLIASYAYSEGDVSTDAALPLQDGEIEAHSALLGYARAIDVWGRSGKIDVVLPYSWLDGKATFAGAPRERTVDGLGDPRFRLSVNLLGAPSLSPQEFASYQQDWILGASLRVTAPLGQYDEDKLLNVGTNRWSLKPELGVSKVWGRLTVEVSSAATLYGDNREFLGDRKREQDPLYSVQTHVIWHFRRNFWGSLDATWYSGGETTLDGVESDDRQRNTRVGGTLAFPVTRRHSLKLYASTGVSERIGGDYDVYGVAWQYRWGAGL